MNQWLFLENSTDAFFHLNADTGGAAVFGLKISVAGFPCFPYSVRRSGRDHDELREPVGAAFVFLERDEENAGHTSRS